MSKLRWDKAKRNPAGYAGIRNDPETIAGNERWHWVVGREPGVVGPFAEDARDTRSLPKKKKKVRKKARSGLRDNKREPVAAKRTMREQFEGPRLKRALSYAKAFAEEKKRSGPAGWSVAEAVSVASVAQENGGHEDLIISILLRPAYESQDRRVLKEAWQLFGRRVAELLQQPVIDLTPAPRDAPMLLQMQRLALAAIAGLPPEACLVAGSELVCRFRLVQPGEMPDHVQSFYHAAISALSGRVPELLEQQLRRVVLQGSTGFLD